VIGFDRRFWHRGEIINLPVDRAFKPRSWWGLTHESAHILLYLNEGWFPLEKLRQVISRRLGRELSNSEVADLSEILLDVFDFTFAYHNDWRFYLATVWSYLREAMDGDEYVTGRFGSYLLRSFSVYFFSRFPDGDARMRVESSVLNKLYEELCADLLKIAKLETKISRDQLLAARERVLFWFTVFRPALPAVAQGIAAYQEAFSRSDSLTMRRASAIALRSILKGEVANGPFNPVQIVLELARKGEIGFPSEIAAVLSLWNEYLRTYRDETAFAPRTLSTSR
jgi:hypothetical protein